MEDFDPNDPNSKYNEKHYLDGLNNLSIDMQMSNQPINFWGATMAKNIIEELNHRTMVRNRVKQLAKKKF